MQSERPDRGRVLGNDVPAVLADDLVSICPAARQRLRACVEWCQPACGATGACGPTDIVRSWHIDIRPLLRNNIKLYSRRTLWIAPLADADLGVVSALRFPSHRSKTVDQRRALCGAVWTRCAASCSRSRLSSSGAARVLATSTQRGTRCINEVNSRGQVEPAPRPAVGRRRR